MTQKSTNTIFETRLNRLPLLARGKVRDIYEVDESHLLIVASDRLSAFDVVMPDPIPGKGEVLTAVSNFWFSKIGHILPNHLSSRTLAEVLPDTSERSVLADRAVVVRKLRPLPVEAIVRGYLAGSGWKDYQATGKICGVALPVGLHEAERLPKVLFTPSTKAASGSHDENIAFSEAERLLGKEMARQVRDVSIQIYEFAAAFALERGIIIADTKFEFGLDENDELVLIDEVLTPDSSRFWPQDEYQPGSSPKSFDKQYVRDYLETLDWNKQAPGPKLPAEVIAQTAARYQQARTILTS